MSIAIEIEELKEELKELKQEKQRYNSKLEDLNTKLRETAEIEVQIQLKAEIKDLESKIAATENAISVDKQLLLKAQERQGNFKCSNSFCWFLVS